MCLIIGLLTDLVTVLHPHFYLGGFVFICCYLILLPCGASRDQNEVLAEDREKLRVLQPLQPWFSQEQREELAEVHSWIQHNTIPEEINTQVHVGTRVRIYHLTRVSPGVDITNLIFCLLGLWQLSDSCRSRPPSSPSCSRQLVFSGDRRAGNCWTRP